MAFKGHCGRRKGDFLLFEDASIVIEVMRHCFPPLLLAQGLKASISGTRNVEKVISMEVRIYFVIATSFCWSGFEKKRTL